MKKTIRLAAALYRNAGDPGAPRWVCVRDARDVTIHSYTSYADAYLGGAVGKLKDVCIEFDMAWDDADAGFAAIRDAFNDGAPIELALKDGALWFSAAYRIALFDCSAPLEGEATVFIVATLAHPLFCAARRRGNRVH